MLWYELIITSPEGVVRVERYTERAGMLRRQHELLCAWKAQGWREMEPEPRSSGVVQRPLTIHPAHQTTPHPLDQVRRRKRLFEEIETGLDILAVSGHVEHLQIGQLLPIDPPHHFLSVHAGHRHVSEHEADWLRQMLKRVERLRRTGRFEDSIAEPPQHRAAK